jgi:hypothetical protein
LRVVGVLGALLLGIVLPIALLADALFGGGSWRDISTSVRVVAVVNGTFGAWLLLVSLLAEREDLHKVLAPLEADMGVVLFLPYMLSVGTRSVWRRLMRRQQGKP